MAIKAKQALSILLVLKLLGLILFTTGFFLNTSSDSTRNECDKYDDPSRRFEYLDPGLHRYLVENNLSNPCRKEGPFDSKVKKAIVIVLDAVRYDFTRVDKLYDHEETLRRKSEGREEQVFWYKNAFTIFEETARKDPKRAKLFLAKAEFPTVTVTRIDATLSGSYPPFANMKENFNSSRTERDNIVYAANKKGLRQVFLGDGIWESLLGPVFQRSTYFSSFDVFDTHNNDLGIDDLIYQEFNRSDWDVLYAHYIGVDHVGHSLNANNPTMRSVLQEFNARMEKIIRSVDGMKATALIVFSDHGMLENGNHGGFDVKEKSAFLFSYLSSDLEFEGKANERNEGSDDLLVEVNQTDIAATVSLLLNLPIPRSNIGTFIAGLVPKLKEDPGKASKGRNRTARQTGPTNPFEKSPNGEEQDRYGRILPLKLSVYSLHNTLQIFDYVDTVESFKGSEGIKKLRAVFLAAQKRHLALLQSISIEIGNSEESLPELVEISREYEELMKSIRHQIVTTWEGFTMSQLWLGMALCIAAFATASYFGLYQFISRIFGIVKKRVTGLEGNWDGILPLFTSKSSFLKNAAFLALGFVFYDLPISFNLQMNQKDVLFALTVFGVLVLALEHYPDLRELLRTSVLLLPVFLVRLFQFDKTTPMLPSTQTNAAFITVTAAIFAYIFLQSAPFLRAKLILTFSPMMFGLSLVPLFFSFNSDFTVRRNSSLLVSFFNLAHFLLASAFLFSPFLALPCFSKLSSRDLRFQRYVAITTGVVMLACFVYNTLAVPFLIALAAIVFVLGRAASVRKRGSGGQTSALGESLLKKEEALFFVVLGFYLIAHTGINHDIGSLDYRGAYYIFGFGAFSVLLVALRAFFVLIPALICSALVAEMRQLGPTRHNHHPSKKSWYPTIPGFDVPGSPLTPKVRDDKDKTQRSPKTLSGEGPRKTSHTKSAKMGRALVAMALLLELKTVVSVLNVYVKREDTMMITVYSAQFLLDVLQNVAASASLVLFSLVGSDA